jgi:pimeloyl-ACP methyl ester carboxylesterase
MTTIRMPPRFVADGRRPFPLVLATATALAVCAAVVRHQVRKAERLCPPTGRFVTIDGVRLRYRERGDGPPLVLLHGNATLAEDFDIAGVYGEASARYRVVAFDRPGFGYSERPHDRNWTPQAQADLIHAAMRVIGITEPAVVVGHSWGAQVALAMGLRHADDVRALVLLSGYYFPSVRLDVPFMSAPAIPVIGSLMRHTVSPLLGRLTWPLFLRRLFAPSDTSPAFKAQFPVWMSLRPSQLRASAAESALMIPGALSLLRQHSRLRVPAVVMAGDSDRLLSTRWHSERLHERLPTSELRLQPGAGHMVHHVAPAQVLAAIDRAMAMGGGTFSVAAMTTRERGESLAV